MPYTMNGVGTWYYGKSNLFSYADFCPYCGRYVTLSSYDTRQWFVILFIPVIPLQKKRILDSCPVCTRHRHLPLKKYLLAKEEAYAKADQDFQQNPKDPEAACRLLQVFAAYQDLPFFDETVPQILQLFPNSHKLLTTVGTINLQYGRVEQARDHLPQSLSVHDDDQVRHMLGFVYTRLSDPDKAAEYFRFILDKQDREKATSLFALVDSCQARGRHQEALAWLDGIAKLDPALAQDKGYIKSRKLSEKYRDSGKPVKNKQISRAHAAKTPLSGKKTWGIAAMVCLALLFIYLSVSFYMGRRANVFLVNGLSRTYDVALNGRTYSLQASAWQKVTVPEGAVDLKVPDDSLQIAPSILKMRSSFWKRPFLERAYVINPDSIAMIEWNKVYYHENVNAAPEAEWQLYFGKQLHVFDRINFPFEPIPDQISMSHSGPEARTQITLFDRSAVLPSRMPAVIEHVLGIEAKIDYLRKIVCYEPANASYLDELLAATDRQTCLETIRPGLDTVPPHVQWHRFYQDAMEAADPGFDLAAEYKARLDKAPDNADLQYLYGRALHQDDAARIWFNKSIQGPDPSAWGYFALGYDAMAVADYQTALGYGEKAIERMPENPAFCYLLNEMLIAVGSLDKAAEFCRLRLLQDPADYNWMLEYVSILRQTGNDAQASTVVEQWCSQNEEIYSPQDLAMLRSSDQLNAAYLTGDLAAIEKSIGEPNELGDKVLLTLHRKAAIADDLIAQADSFSPLWLLLFYISESRLGNEQNAALFFDAAIKHFEKGDFYQRCVCSCFNADPAALEDICGLSLEPDLKATVLTVLGVRFPEHRRRFFDLAHRLNYKKAFPYHFLNFIHEEYPANPADAAAGRQI